MTKNPLKKYIKFCLLLLQNKKLILCNICLFQYKKGYTIDTIASMDSELYGKLQNAIAEYKDKKKYVYRMWQDLSTGVKWLIVLELCDDSKIVNSEDGKSATSDKLKLVKVINTENPQITRPDMLAYALERKSTKQLVLTSEQFDEYYAYLIKRSDCHFRLHGWIHFVDNVMRNIKDIVYQNATELISDQQMRESIYVQTTSTTNQKVEIIVDWYYSTLSNERVQNAHDWLKRFNHQSS